jgi:hypothetical protein
MDIGVHPDAKTWPGMQLWVATPRARVDPGGW